MKLEWMGPYREIVRRLICYGNLYARASSAKITDDTGIVLTSLEWQAMECILEFEDENYNMAVLASKMCVPPSTFSKYVKALLEKNLVSRFQREDNNKDIILRLTDLGRELYRVRSGHMADEWRQSFAMLESLDEEQLAAFSSFIEDFAEAFNPNKKRPTMLIKVD
jgi:DNA-binding MarR family transcriptional regulator